MKLTLDRNKYTFVGSNSDTFSDVLRFLANQHIKSFPETVVVKDSTIPQERIRDVLTVIYQITSFHDTGSYYPEDVGESSNFLTVYKDWSEVPCYQRYVNHRTKIISDPEYLLIYWSTIFESFDVNNNALLPGYPKSMTNVWHTPQEIGNVCRLMLLEWTVNGMRSKEIPMTHKNALRQFKESFPLIYDLVFTSDGATVLEAVYQIILLSDKDYCQSKEIRKKCIAIFQTMLKNIRNKGLQAYMRKNDRIAVYSTGMRNPRILGQCLLTIYFSYSYFFLPSENIYHLDGAVLGYIQKVKDIYHKQHPNGIYKVDYDPKKKQNILQPFSCVFFQKSRVDKINSRLKRPGYSKFFESLTPTLFCSTRSEDNSLKV